MDDSFQITIPDLGSIDLSEAADNSPSLFGQSNGLGVSGGSLFGAGGGGGSVSGGSGTGSNPFGPGHSRDGSTQSFQFGPGALSMVGSNGPSTSNGTGGGGGLGPGASAGVGGSGGNNGVGAKGHPPLRNPFANSGGDGGRRKDREKEAPSSSVGNSNMMAQTHSRTKSQVLGSTNGQPVAAKNLIRKVQHHKKSSSGASDKIPPFPLPNGTGSLATPLAGTMLPRERITLQNGGRMRNPGRKESMGGGGGGGGHNVVLDGEASGSPSMMALIMIVDQFLEKAETKIGRLLAEPPEREVYIPSVLAEGVDKSFDALLKSLAKVAKIHPKEALDRVMFWRQSQNDMVDSLAFQRVINTSSNPSHATSITAVLKERRSRASIYVLCRALSAIVNSLSRESLRDEYGIHLEDIIFGSILNAEPHMVARSSSRQANLDFQAQVLGSLSGIRFQSVADRFVAVLGQIEKGNVPKEAEPKYEQVIRSMRFLKLKVWPETAFEEAAEFMESVARVFEASRGLRLKSAMVDTILALLQPIVPEATAEVNLPQWTKAVQFIYAKALGLSGKPRYAMPAMQLVCTVTAVSPQDMLIANWSTCLDLCLGKVKDKMTRPLALYGVLQLTWAYLHRCQDSAGAAAKRLDPLLKVLFPPGRRPLANPEVPTEVSAYVVQFIFHRYYEWGSEYILGLLTPSVTGSGSEMHSRFSSDTLNPDRMTAAVKAVGLVIECMLQGGGAKLPPPEASLEVPTPNSKSSDEKPDKPQNEAALARPAIQSFMEQCGTLVLKIAAACDASLDGLSVFQDRNLLPTGAIGTMHSQVPIDRETYAIKQNGLFTVIYPREKQVIFDLLSACLDLWPRLRPPEASDIRMIDILVRALVHVNADCNLKAKSALERLTSQRRGHLVVKALTSFLNRPEFSLRETSSFQTASTAKLEALVRTWVSVVTVWSGKMQRKTTTRSHGHNRQGSDKDKAYNGQEVEPFALRAILHDLEATAFAFLLDSSTKVRHSSLEVVRLVAGIGQSVADSPTDVASQRLLTFLEAADQLVDDIIVKRPLIPEMNALQRWAREKQEKMVLGLIKSGVTSDHGLWQQLCPCLMSAYSAANLEVTGRLRAILSAKVGAAHPIASAGAGLVHNRPPPTPSTIRTFPFQTPVAAEATNFLVDYWKAHLTALFSIAPIQAGADGASPLLPNAGTGQELVRMTLPFLASEHPVFRECVIQAMGAVHISAFRPVLDNLHQIIKHLGEDKRTRPQHQSPPRRSQRNTRLHMAVAKVHELTSHHLHDAKTPIDDEILDFLTRFISETFFLLREPESLDDQGLEHMRRSLCVVVDAYVNRTSVPSGKSLSPDLVHDLYVLFEHWCLRPVPASPVLSRSDPPPALSQRRSSSVSQFRATEIYRPAATVMTALCSGGWIAIRLDDAEQRRDGGRSVGINRQELIRWIATLLDSPHAWAHDLGRDALRGMLVRHPDRACFLEAVISQTFVESDAAPLHQTFFGVLCQLLIDNTHLDIRPSTLKCLGLWKLSHADLAVRQKAIELLALSIPVTICESMLPSSEVALFSSHSGSTFSIQQSLSETLASQHPSEAHAVASELAMRILQLGSRHCRATMQLLPAWLSNITLSSEWGEHAKPSSDPLLSNLFLLSSKYADSHYNETRNLWTSLAPASKPLNRMAVVNFLVDEVRRRASVAIARCSQKILSCLSHAGSALGVLKELASIVAASEHPHAVDLPKQGAGSRPTQVGGRRATLDSVFPPLACHQILPRSQAALLIVGDVLCACVNESSAPIAFIVHGLTVGVDHSNLVIRGLFKETLTRVMSSRKRLRRWNLNESSNIASREIKRKEAATSADQWRWSQFWDYPDNGNENSCHVPTNLESLVIDAVEAFSTIIPDFRKVWAATALSWATTSPVRHTACRSLQVLRILAPDVDQRFLVDIVARLSAAISDESPDMQVFSLELLRTITACARSSRPDVLASVPQVFWTAAASLATRNEREFAEAAKLVSAVLETVDQISPEALALFEAARPPSFDSPDEVLRLLLLKGLRSSSTAAHVWTILHKLLSSPLKSLFSPDSDGLLLVYAATLPRCLSAQEQERVPNEMEVLAMDLSAQADLHEKHGISRFMVSFARLRFRAKEDFVRSAVSNIRDYFSTTQRITAFIVLLGSLFNSGSGLRVQTLVILKAMARAVNLTEEDIRTLGADLYSPLLGLLTSDLSAKALEVLEEPLPGIQGAESHARNPTAPSSNDREQDLTFGVPNGTGWCDPTPSASTAATRAKLREVMDTCSTDAIAPMSISPVEFTEEDFEQNSIGPLMETGTHSDFGDRSTLGDMVSTLHDLSSFFDEDDARPVNYRMSQALGSASRVAAVLSRSVTRTPSASSTASTRWAVRTEGPLFAGAFAEPPSSYTEGHSSDESDHDDESSLSHSHHGTPSLHDGPKNTPDQIVEEDSDPEDDKDNFALEKTSTNRRFTFFGRRPSPRTQWTQQ